MMSVLKWKPYPKYQHTNELLGEIPSHWGVIPLKRDFEVQLGKMLQNEQKNETDTHEYFLKSANIQWEGVSIENINKMWFSEKEKAKFLLKEGDLLISEGGDVGRSCIFENEIDECYIQNAVNRVRSKSETTTRYMYYWMKALHSAGIIDIICNKSTIPHFTAEKVAEVRYYNPTIEEKDIIVRILDSKSLEIQSAIEVLQTSQKRLEEKRSALITQAVTRGLDPDVPMKETGNGFFPLIPQHWGLQCMKHIVDERRPITYGIVQCGPDLGEGVPYVRPVDMTDEGGVDMNNIQFTSEEIAKSYSRSSLKEGDLVVSIGPSYGKVMKIPSELEGANLTQGTARVAVDSKYNTDFFFWAMRSSPMSQQWDSVAQGATFRALNLVPLWNSYVPTPPLNEQIEIARKLREDTSVIDQMLGSNFELIQKLKEYRTALISAAVTGKIDLREWQGTGDDA